MFRRYNRYPGGFGNVLPLARVPHRLPSLQHWPLSEYRAVFSDVRDSDLTRTHERKHCHVCLDLPHVVELE
jgi:hypothetical protein